MDTAKNEEIIEYLKKAFELESKVYLTKKIISQLNSKLKEVEGKELIDICEAGEHKSVTPEEYVNNNKGIRKFIYKGNLTYHILGLAIGLISFMLARFFLSQTIGGWNAILTDSIYYILFAVLLISGIYFFWGVGVFGLITGFFGKMGDNRKNAKSKKEYEKNLPMIKQIKTELVNNISDQNNVLKDIEKQKDDLYSKDIVHSKYRNMVTISMLLEYFDTGRCNEFTGPNGAYNLYENEIRQNVIIENLSNINSNLKQIKRNQTYLFNALTVINQNINNLNVTLNNIDDSINRTANAITLAVGSASTYSYHTY